MTRTQKFVGIALLVTSMTATLVGCGSSPDSTTASISSTAASSTQTPPPTPGVVTISGAVTKPLSISIADLQSYPPQTRDVTFQSSAGTQAHSYVGASLADLLDNAEPVKDPAAKNSLLRMAVSATGADGYSATLSWGEISPDFAGTPIIVAYTEDATPLTQPRLVVPGDIKGGRYISDLTDVNLIDLGAH